MVDNDWDVPHTWHMHVWESKEKSHSTGGTVSQLGALMREGKCYVVVYLMLSFFLLLSFLNCKESAVSKIYDRCGAGAWATGAAIYFQGWEGGEQMRSEREREGKTLKKPMVRCSMMAAEWIQETGERGGYVRMNRMKENKETKPWSWLPLMVMLVS